MAKDTRPGGALASRRILALLLALVMMLSLAAPAWAEEEEGQQEELTFVPESEDDIDPDDAPVMPSENTEPPLQDGDEKKPNPANNTYEIDGVTYYNVHSDKFDIPGYYLKDLLDIKTKALGGWSMADRWMQLGFLIAADTVGFSDDWDRMALEGRGKTIGDFKCGYWVSHYAASLSQGRDKNGGYKPKPYFTPEEADKQQDVVTKHMRVQKTNSNDFLEVAVYFTDFSAVALLPDASVENNYVTHVNNGQNGNHEEERQYVSNVKNLSGEEVTASQNVSTGWSNTISSEVGGSNSYSFSESITAGMEIGFNVFGAESKAKMESTISATQAFENNWKEGKSTSKSGSVDESIAVVLPPYTNVVLSQGHANTDVDINYNCPIGLKYNVIIAVSCCKDNRAGAFCFRFDGGDARADLLRRAIQYGPLDVEISSGGNNLAVHWNNVFKRYQAKNIAELVSSRVPMSDRGASFHQVLNTSYTEVKEIAPILPLSFIRLKAPDVSFISDEMQSYQNLNYLSATMKAGESSYTNYIKLEGLNQNNAPYYGFNSLKGHWIVTRPDDTDLLAWTGPDAPVVLEYDPASGLTRYTAVRPGKCYLKYVIDEGIYGTVDNVGKDEENAVFTSTWMLQRTAALEITVEGHKEYTEPQGTVNVSGSYVGAVGNKPDSLDKDGALAVQLLDLTGREVSYPVVWEKQELDNRGILVDENNQFYFTRPGTFHVRAVCGELDASSDWVEIHVHEYTFGHGDTADTVKAECVEGDGVTGTLTIHAPAKTAYNDMSSPEATVTGSVPGLDTPDIDIVYSWRNTELPEAPTEPGEYMASFTLGGVRAQVSYIIQGSYVINPPVARSLTYTGEEQNLVNPGKANDVMLYACGNSDGREPDRTLYSAALPQAMYAGMYYVWYKAADHTGGFPDSAVYGPIPVEIAKAERPAPEAPTVAYITPNSITLNEIENGEYRIGSNPWQDSPVFDGLQYRSGYNFQQRYKEDGNYTISPASEKVVLATGNMESLTTHPPYARVLDYTGQPQELVVRGQPSLDHHRDYYYALGTDSTTQPPKEAFSSNVPTGTEMGAYYVWYTDEYYSYHCLTSWIKPIKGPTPVAKTVTAHRVVLEAMENVMFAYDDHQSQSTAWDWREVPDFEDLLPDTEYTFYAYYKETSVFPQTPIGDGLTVRTAKTQDPIPKAGLMYNMESQALLEGGVTDEEGYEYRYAVKSDAPTYTSAIPTGTDAGDYSILFAVFDKANGSMVGEPGELVIPIAKAIPKLIFPNDRLPATGELQPLVIDPVVFPKVDGLTVYYSTDGFNDVLGLPEGDDIGIYRIYYRVDSTNPNVATIFYGHGAEIRIVGDAEKMAPDLAVSIENWTYDDEPKTPEITGNPDRIPITLSYKRRDADDSDYAASLPVDAGEYVVRAVAGSDLYDNTKTVTADFTVYQKYPVMGDDYDIRPIEGTICDGEYQNLVTPTVRPDSSLRIWFSFDRKNTLAGTPKKRDAGEYDIWYKVMGDPNYVELTEWSGPVTAEIIGEHTVHLMPAEFGKLSVDKMSALPGETVTITATPDTEYALKTLVVRRGDMSVPFTRNADSTFSFTMPSTDVYVSALFAQSAIIGCDLRLDGTIGMRFYVVLSESFVNDPAWMELSIHDRHYEIPLSEADYIDGCHVFTCPVYALEMAEPISAVFHYGDTGVARKFISIRQYLEDMRNAGLMDVSILDAIANYGHYVQPYLGRLHGYTFGPDGDYEEMPAATQITALKELPEFRRQMGEHGWNRDVVQSMSYNLAHNENNTLRFTFKLKTAPAAVSITVDGEEWPVEKLDGNIYRIEIPNIAANNLGKAWHIELTADGTIVYDTYASALSYADAVLTLDRAEDENLAVTALYDYYAAARDYAN